MKQYLIMAFFSVGVLFQTSVGMAQAYEERKPRVGDIKDHEIERIDRRVKSHKFSSFGFGPFGYSTSNEGGIMYGLSYGNHWEANENGEIRFDVQGAGNSASQFFNLGLGYGYMPFTSDVSPIFGAELGGGFAHYKKGGDGKNAGGFSGGVLTGLRMFRTADTQLELLASYHAVFANDTPGIYGLQLRILY